MQLQVTPESPDAALELGRWMGRREAFALIAGRCSAADVESLQRLRDEKLYKLLCRSWDEFCEKKLKVCRRQADRLIGQLKEFGPQYFHIAQMTHVTVEEYRAIAPHVTEEGLRWDGAAIALLPENSAQIAEGVKELLKRERPAGEKGSAGSAVMKRFASAVEALCAYEGPMDDGEMKEFGEALTKALHAGGRRGPPPFLGSVSRFV